MINKGKGTEKLESHYNLPHYYDFYRESTFKNDWNHPYYIKRSLYNKILKEYYKEISRMIIYENYEYKLPSRLGVICIRKYKPLNKIENGELINKLPVDIGATMKLWNSNEEARKKKILLRHLNKHTDGYVAKFFLIKHTANFKNKSLYNFTATRTNKREVTVALKNPKLKIDYFKLKQ